MEILVLLAAFLFSLKLIGHMIESLFLALGTVLETVFRILSWMFNGFSLLHSRREQQRLWAQREQHRQSELQRRSQLKTNARARRQELARVANARKQNLLKEASEQGRDELRNLNQMIIQLDQTTRKLQKKKAGTDEILRLRQQMYDLESQKQDIVKRLKAMGFPPPRYLTEKPVPVSAGPSRGRGPRGPSSCRQKNHGFLISGC